MTYHVDPQRETNIPLGTQVEALDASGKLSLVDVVALDDASLEAWILQEVGTKASPQVRAFAVAQIFTLLGRKSSSFDEALALIS